MPGALIDEKYSLTQGPLPKTKYTYWLENLTRRLMRGDGFNTHRKGNEFFIEFKTTINSRREYNFSQIIKYTNFGHIYFTEADFNAYLRFESTQSVRSSLYWWTPRLKNLHLAEMKAINLYTGRHFVEMNSLLRGYAEPTRGWVIHTVMCASGLAKLPPTTVTACYRGETIYDKAVHETRISYCEQQKTTQIRGFISASVTAPLGYDVKIHFKNVRGGEVSRISEFNFESEFLALPTSVRWLSYDSSSDTFDAEMVQDLALYSEDEQTVPNYSELTDIYLEYLNLLEDDALRFTFDTLKENLQQYIPIANINSLVVNNLIETTHAVTKLQVSEQLLYLQFYLACLDLCLKQKDSAHLEQTIKRVSLVLYRLYDFIHEGYKLYKKNIRVAQIIAECGTGYLNNMINHLTKGDILVTTTLSTEQRNEINEPQTVVGNLFHRLLPSALQVYTESARRLERLEESIHHLNTDSALMSSRLMFFSNTEQKNKTESLSRPAPSL